MNKTRLLTMIIVVCLAQSLAFSQTQDPPKFELAAEFTTLEREGFSGRTEPGFGGRFTYNLNKTFALEAAGYFFPKQCFFECRNPGRVLQTVGGVKAGKRFEKWGIFAKARPGVVSFSDGEINLLPLGPLPSAGFEVRQNRVTSFATDVGGVVEFYPSRRIVTRFDAGDTIIYFTQRTTNDFRINPITNLFEVGPVTRPARTTHNFQFVASVGFRF